MSLYDQIISVYSELDSSYFGSFGLIELNDDSDGLGAYIAKWDYSKPIPSGMKLGK